MPRSAVSSECTLSNRLTHLLKVNLKKGIGNDQTVDCNNFSMPVYCNSRRHQKCYHIFMIEQQILITIATLAVTLAGFSGVVGIFTKELPDDKTYKLETLLFQSGVALFASLTTLITSQIGGALKSEEEFRGFWMISSWVYIIITIIALIFATIDIIKTKRYKEINYDILFYFSFFIVVALLIFNALYIQDAYLFHIALEINLAFAFVSFYTLVIPPKG